MHFFFPLDINECREIDNYCSNGTCTNTIGGSKCECSLGYHINPSGDDCEGVVLFCLPLKRWKSSGD